MLNKIINDLLANLSGFNEKNQQITPNTVTAFGVTICTRYGKLSEMIEMLEFTQETAQSSVAHYVKSIFYDSKASLCSFTLDESLKNQDGEIERCLLAIARKHISNFEWIDDTYYDQRLSEK